MKLAVMNIHGRFFMQYHLLRLNKAGIETDFAVNPWDFLSDFRTFKNYGGVLMHPPLGYHLEWINTVRSDSASSKLALATNNIGTRVEDKDFGLTLFDWGDVDGIKEYFFGKDVK